MTKPHELPPKWRREAAQLYPPTDDEEEARYETLKRCAQELREAHGDD